MFFLTAVLLLLAFLCFILEAANYPHSRPFNLLPLGLALWALAALIKLL